MVTYTFVVVDDNRKEVEPRFEEVKKTIKNIDVVHCSNEEELFDYLKNNDKPDFIFLDMEFRHPSGYMPTAGNTKGIDIAQKLKQEFTSEENQTCPFKIIIYSSKHDYEDEKFVRNVQVIAKALEAGATGFISKGPVSVLTEQINWLIHTNRKADDYLFDKEILRTIVEGFLRYSKSPHQEKKLYQNIDEELKNIEDFVVDFPENSGPHAKDEFVKDLRKKLKEFIKRYKDNELSDLRSFVDPSNIIPKVMAAILICTDLSEKTIKRVINMDNGKNHAEKHVSSFYNDITSYIEKIPESDRKYLTNKLYNGIRSRQQKRKTNCQP